jgi:hypothetical protein
MASLGETVLKMMSITLTLVVMMSVLGSSVMGAIQDYQYWDDQGVGSYIDKITDKVSFACLFFPWNYLRECERLDYEQCFLSLNFLFVCVTFPFV